MTTVSYIFGDARTGKIVEEISLYGVNISRTMNDGEMTATFQFDQIGKRNEDLAAATTPGRSFVVAERDGEPIWGGIVGSATYQAQSKSCQLYARVLEAYPDRRYIRQDITSIGEQQQLFLNLYNLMQADPYSINVALPTFTGPTLVSKSLSIKATEFKSYRSAIDSLADGENGFDWTIDWSRTGGTYVKTLRMGYPILGSINERALLFEYPGNIFNYWETRSIGGAGTNIFAVGAGEGSTMLTTEVIHQDLLNSNFPRYDVLTSHKDITSLALLDDIAQQEATIRRAPAPVITAELKADLDPVFGSYSVGDACTIIFKDAPHPGTGGFTRATRVLGYTYVPPSSDSAEVARLTFEGEDL
jgi:hypothetical protein